MIRFMAAIRLILTTTAWLVGGPVMLLAIGGSPIPRHPPSEAQVQAWLHDPLDPVYKQQTAREMAWTLWALITIAILWLFAARVGNMRWARLVDYLPGPVQGLAAALLGTAVVATSTSALLTPTADTTTSTSDPHDYPSPPAPPAYGDTLPGSLITVSVVHATPDEAIHPSETSIDSETAGCGRPAATAPGRRYRVRPGDTLWQIAETQLGNPSHWHQIYRLNRGHEQTNGHALADPDQIDVGWTLALPATSSPTTLPHRAHQACDTDDLNPAPHRSAPSSTSPARPSAPSSPALATPRDRQNATPAMSDPAAPTAHSGAAHAEPPTPTTPRSGRNPAGGGITLPDRGWVSASLAMLIASVASLLRLQQRRRARLRWPIPTHTGAQRAPVPERLAILDAAHARAGDDQQPPTPRSPVAAPAGLDAAGHEVSLFDLPGPGITLSGEGARPAARALLAALLTTGATGPTTLRPVVVTTAEVLAQLLPDGAPLIGLDPDGTTYDGERLMVLDDAAAAVTHAEEEMIIRRRLLDTFQLDSITALNERTDHAEMQPPYVLLIEATTRHAARLLAIGAHRAALDMHPVVMGALDGIPSLEIAVDGTTTDGSEVASRLARLSTLGADDLAAVLALLTEAAPRPEPGHDIDLNCHPSLTPASDDIAEPVPAQRSEVSAPVRLRILGPIQIETESGPVATGMRTGSYLVLASLAAHPSGRTLDQLAADLHPDTDPPTAAKRIRTDISTARRVLRSATGLSEPMFVIHDPATGRYRLDPQLITVDLWRMLTAIETANSADDDSAALTALREATRCYVGDFADGHDQTWIIDQATTYRHQILSAYARIAELLEADQPDQAVAALERAMGLDPVNEELYQRIMRIHGRAGRTDQVRRTLRRLEECLADLGDAEPSEATRRVAERQLRAAATSGGVVRR